MTIDALSVGMARISRDGKFLWVSPLFNEIIGARGVSGCAGQNYEDAIGALLTAAGGFSGPGRTAFLQARRQALEAAADTYRIGAPGEWALHFTCAPDDGQGLLLTVADLSAIEQHDAIITNAERMSHSGAWQYDLQTRKLDFSEGAWDVFGPDSRQRTATIDQWIAAVHPDDRERMASEVTEATSNLRPYGKIEYRFYRTDGVLIELAAQGLPVTDASGQARWYRGVFSDVTEIRDAQRALARSEETIRAIVENSPDIIGIIDPAGHVTFVSPAITSLLGYPKDAVVGHAFHEFIHPADLPIANDALARMRSNPGRKERIELRVRDADGSWRDFEVVARGLDHNPALGGVVINTRDISQRKVVEQQLRSAQKMEAVGQLTGGLAHDFNNLLAIISGNTQMLIEQLEALGGQDALVAMARRSLTAVDRGAELTRSLLAFARRQTLSPRNVDIDRVVDEMIELVRRTMPENIAVNSIGTDDLWLCCADPGQLQQALLNLVVNARDAMPDGGTLLIETANVALDGKDEVDMDDVAPGEYVMLAVSDTGAGMPPEVVRRAFDPFFTTKGLAKGTGLGLSMVYGFAKQSKGHVKIYSEPGTGTTVKLYLPRSDAAIEDPAATEVAHSNLRGHEHVLVVEDNPDVLSMTCDLLQSFGYTVDVADGGDAALKMLAQHPDLALVLTDVMLAGGLNGAELARLIQTTRPGLPVVFMSGYTDNAILHSGRLDAGARLIQKPFRGTELGTAIRAALDGRTA